MPCDHHRTMVLRLLWPFVTATTIAHGHLLSDHHRSFHKSRLSSRFFPICRVAHAFVSKPFRHKLSLSIGSRESFGDFHFSTASMAEVKDQLKDAYLAELVQAGDAQDAMTQVEGTPEEAKGEENGEAKGEENGAAKGQENGEAKGEEKGEEKRRNLRLYQVPPSCHC